MQSRTYAGRWAVPAAAILAAAAAAPPRLAAQGVGLNEIGSCAIARGFATTGAPCDDASVLYWNPAAATTLRGTSFYGGVSFIQLGGRFTADTTGRVDDADAPLEYPPFAGVVWRGTGARTSRLALGVAAYVPYGLTSQWREDFPGRFLAQRVSLRTIYVQPTVAFELVPGRLSLGGGPVIGHSAVELRQAIDFSQQQVPGTPAGFRFAHLGFVPGTEFARAELEGDATAVGFHVGAHLRPLPGLSIGARYLSRVDFEYDGATATFTPSPVADTYVLLAGNPLGAAPGTTLRQLTAEQFGTNGALRPGQTGATRIDHPAQLQLGLGFRPAGRTLVSVDYARIFWSSFDELPLVFNGEPDGPLSTTLIEEYEDINSYRAGLEHRFVNGVAGRLGFSYSESAAPDVTVTPLLPDMDRYDLSAGVGVPLGSRFALDAAYLRVETEGRRGRVRERTSRSQTAEELNTGAYALNANVFSLGLKARF